MNACVHFGTLQGTDGISIMNMGAMVKRDRNHPSVVIWSYCNEGGCGHGGPGTGAMLSRNSI
jgi:hypothetical protein